MTCDPLEPKNVSAAGFRDALADTSILQLPEESATHGFDGATLAPRGRPVSVIDSAGRADPQTRAGVTPPDQASDEASTMCDPNTQPSGPQLVEEQSPLAEANGENTATRKWPKRTIMKKAERLINPRPPQHRAQAFKRSSKHNHISRYTSTGSWLNFVQAVVPRGRAHHTTPLPAPSHSTVRGCVSTSLGASTV
jgi:hypothetical protein